MKAKDKPKFCFAISMESATQNYPGADKYFHINTSFHPRYVSGFHPYNDGKNHDFRDLRLVSQGHTGADRLYGIELNYRECFSLTEKDLSSKLKALQWVHKNLQMIAVTEGSFNQGDPLDGGYVEFLKRMAKILPLAEIIVYLDGVALYRKEVTDWPEGGEIEATIENFINNKI